MQKQGQIPERRKKKDEVVEETKKHHIINNHHYFFIETTKKLKIKLKDQDRIIRFGFEVVIIDLNESLSLKHIILLYNLF